MAEIRETPRQYFIPDNFIEEGRVFQGRFKIRNLIEGIVLGMFFGSAGIALILIFPQMKLELKVTLIAVLVIPSLLLGIAGFNGDTISVTIKSAVTWKKNRDTMLYNPKPRLLKRDPLMTVISQTSARDRILENIEERRQESIREKANLIMSEGEDFRFAVDEHVDAYTKRLRKSRAESKGKPEKEFLIKSGEMYGKTGNADSGSFDPNLELDIGEDFITTDDAGIYERREDNDG